ncbi:unnamed protein product [Paramecium primaurelia]|uniref:Uncharacterized protein n=1 Tax=Paramecium primaurelia TaxID=5886 RepID=A0A8S1LBM4_PARPR|nr:unnamed protein product [Paramecium primaurelia]
MIEQNYLCAGNHQGAQIIMVSFDPTLKRNQRLLCQKCLDDLQLPTKVEGFQKTLDSIQDIDNVLKILDALIKVVTDWKMQFQQISKTKIVYSFLDELESLVYRQQHYKQQEILERINKMN